jgi:type VI secretion system VgrG family protein
MLGNDTLVRIETDLIDGELQVARLRGSEWIGRPFELEATVVLPGKKGVDVEELVSGEMTLVFETKRSDRDVPSQVFRRHGVVSECRDAWLDAEHTAYVITIVPRMWLCSLVETLDIFMGLSIPDIIRKKLSMFGFHEDKDFAMRLSGNYEPREFVVQFKETDLAFISRLCEHWGISFFFEFEDGRDVVVFTDHNGGFRPAAHGGKASFTARGGDFGVTELERTTRAVPRRFVQRDYDYRHPATDLHGSAEMPDGLAGGIVEYGGHFRTEDEGAYLATLRAEQKRAERCVYDAATRLPHIAPGTVLTVEGHRRGDVELLVSEVHHFAQQTTLLASDQPLQPYRNRVKAIDEAVTYRPPRRTDKPRVNGVLTGIVDAPAHGEYAELDSEGRYRIRFMFDTSGQGEGKASRPLRMMQPHTGAGYGMHFPLRPGIEVLITFMDGDPDRPIIAGTVPNPQTASPVTAQNAARNVIRTGGGNEINFDDKDGEQRIKLSSPHMNTVFQIGSPNAPEAGAMLSTGGAISNLSVMGQSSVSSVGTTINAFRAFSASRVISTVAQPTNKWKAFLLGVKAVDACFGVLTSLLTEAENIAKAVANGADVAAKALKAANNAAQETYATNANAAASGRADLEAVANTALNPTAELQAYDEAVTALTKQEVTLNKLKVKLDAAKLNPSFQGQTIAMLEAKVAAAQAEYASLKVTMKAKAALLDAKLILLAAEPDPVGAAATAQQGKLTAYDAFLAKKEETDAPIRNAAATKAWVTTGYVGQTLTGLRTTVKVIQGAAGWFNLLLSLISLIKQLKGKFHEEGQWARAALNLTDVGSQLAPSAKTFGFGIAHTPPAKPGDAIGLPELTAPDDRHTVGSKGTMTMFGSKRVLVHSPLLVLSGAPNLGAAAAAAEIVKEGVLLGTEAAHDKGSVIAVAEHDVLLTAKHEAELNGKEKACVASNTEVLVSAKPKAILVPGSDAEAPQTKKEAKVELNAKGEMLLEATKYAKLIVDNAKKNGFVEVSNGGDQVLKLQQAFPALGSSATLSSPGKVELSAGDKVKISMDEVAGKLEATVGTGPTAAVFSMSETGITLKLGSMAALELKPDGAVLKFGAATALKLAAADATLGWGPNSLKVTAGGVEEKGTLVRHG